MSRSSINFEDLPEKDKKLIEDFKRELINEDKELFIGQALERIKQRFEGQQEWLKLNAPYIFTEQKHLDKGTIERIYWHYGYMIASRDIYNLLKRTKGCDCVECEFYWKGVNDEEEKEKRGEPDEPSKT